MENNIPAPAECPKPRRVGTFTFGAVLVLAGGLMLVSMFFPAVDLLWALKLSPLALVSLGTEVLLAARKSGSIKYDWVGMLLCFLVVTTSLVLFAVSWWMVHHPEDIWDYQHYSGSREGTEQSLVLNYDIFNGDDFQLLELEAGDVLEADIFNQSGTLDVSLVDDTERYPVYEADGLFQTRLSIDIPESGIYELWVCGNSARGRASFQLAQP